jgi:deoxyribonuclease-4
MSVAGGYENAVTAARAHGCQALQLFTKNANQWQAKDLTDDEVRRFRSALRGSGVRVTMAHDSYLINLASPDRVLFERSLEAFLVELQRAERLRLHYLIMHPGSPGEDNVDEGLARVAGALDEVHQRCPGFRVKVLLETTAGQGYTLGHRFEQLGRILELVKQHDRLGVCLDTCHVFAAGYALAPEADYRATMRSFDRAIGLKRLRVFHVNDSLKPLGSRKDRHAHIGRGCLGLVPFRLLVNDPRFRSRPMILETPKEDADEGDMDAVNLDTLRRLVARR